MCKADLVYGVATDDMDALTFGTPRLIRHLMAPGNNQKLTIDEFDMPAILEQMGLTQARAAASSATWQVSPKMRRGFWFARQGVGHSRFVLEAVRTNQSVRPRMQEQFIDICILCGCDYCGTIRGIGPKRALQLISEHKTLEKAVASLDKAKFTIPDPFPIEVRRLASQCPRPCSPPHSRRTHAP